MEVTQKPFNRKKPDQLVYLELGSGNGGMLLSIAEDGFRFRAVSPLRADGLMPFAFSLDGHQRLQGIGEVEWLEDDGKSGGMRFVEVSPDFRAALNQWLALDSSRGKSAREVTPAAATPLDTMEKIREELRRGYPQRPATASAHKEPGEASSDVAALKQPSPQKAVSESQPQPAQPAGESTGGSQLRTDRKYPAEQVRERTTEKEQERPNFRQPAPTSSAERQPGNHSPSRPIRSNPDRNRSPEQRSQPFYPPPFTHSAESEPESPAETEKASSAFLKKPASAPVSPPAENPSTLAGFGASQQAVPAAPEPTRSREDAHASTEALRRPFRQESRSSRPERVKSSERPYIPPPVDESFEAAWERAKLTAPPESPHLSRAAAGSIIGVALAVILGALAFNFRQDIGTLVIDLGQKISGEHRTSVPSSQPDSGAKTESQTPANAGTSETSSPNRADTAAGTAGVSTQLPAGSSNPVNSHEAAAGASHDSGSVTHDVPSGSSGTNVTRGSSPAASTSGTANRTSGGAAVGSVPPPISAGSGTNPAASSAIGTEPGSGEQEFNAAREMLKGDHRHRDLSSAVNLLWAGVRKGYVPAEVTLADLYRRGDGVEKNCDQAQVLLVAASKKGSPEARQLLEKMAEEGCSE